MEIEKRLDQINKNESKVVAKSIFNELIQKSQMVGDLYSINYETAKVIVHEYYRNRVGGIPSLSFLVASRVNPDSDDIDFTKEDSSFILLRVMDATSLPQDQEAERIRVETAQRISGETDSNWDDHGSMDPKTKNLLSFAGIKCRIIGTFYLEPEDETGKNLCLKFGSDISNYYPNQGLKVYKPNGKSLEKIVNYCDPINLKSHTEKYNNSECVELGQVRYASTNRNHQNISNVPVYIYPADLLSQKTALFGMTRTGKSNTTKIIAKSVFELRTPKQNSDSPVRIGQIIFDPNGEYANENSQDKDGDNNPNALKNIWRLIPDGKKEQEVVTFGITKHKNDPDRNLMLLNFFTDENLTIGKSIIDTILGSDGPNYIKNFVHVSLEAPDTRDFSAMTRHKRRVLAYRSILVRAGFDAPSNIQPYTKGLFKKELRIKMEEYDGDNSTMYHSAAKVLSNERPTWDQLASAFEALDKFIRENNSGYKDFEDDYINSSSSGESWADEDLKKLLGIFQYHNGTRKIGEAKTQHSANTSTDYAIDIYRHLKEGKLIIIDQSSGEPELNKSSAERIMWEIFRKNQTDFRNGDIPPEILVYLEEAHNILPSGSDLDLSDVWVRTAKEGAKYKIGMVYATQEVSSIQKNILKNTANWFISHLNNTDETKELTKYYDFADFEPSIRRAQDKGFVRVKTLSNLFVIPVQIKLFDVGASK